MKSTHPRLLIGCLAVLLALGLGACASTAPKVRVDRADTDLTNCRTFDWLPASKDAASFTEQRVRSAAMAELQEKGYAQATDKPDCRITYLLSMHQQVQRKPSVGVGAGGGSGGVRGGIGVNIPVGRQDGHVGTLTLDIVDVARNAQVWSGSIETRFDSSEPTEEEVRDAVRTILAEFPDRVDAMK